MNLPDADNSKRVARIPFAALGGKFAGRKALLGDLENKLHPGKALSLSQCPAVKAAGGVGKTTLAIEAASRLFDTGRFDRVFLVNGRSPEMLDLDLALLCERDWLNLPGQDAREHRTRFDAVLGWLKQPDNAPRTLLVLDGANTGVARAHVREIRALLPGCAMLATSRLPVGGDFEDHEVGLFDKDEAREFLRAHLDADTLQDADADAVLDGVAQALDCFPLALELLAGLLRESKQTPQAWLEEWGQSPTPAVEHEDAEMPKYPDSFARLLGQSLARLSSKAREQFNPLAWLAPLPAGYPLRLLGAQEKWKEVLAWFTEMEKASLIRWSEQNREVSIHSVVRAALRRTLDGDAEENSKMLALKYLVISPPDPLHFMDDWQIRDRLMPHMDAFNSALHKTPLERKTARLVGQFGAWLHQRGLDSRAEPLMRRAVEIDEAGYGKDSPQVAVRLNNLALFLKATNRLEEAEAAIRRALAIDEKKLGKDHPSVAIRLNNLASLMQANNRLEEAETLLRRSLEIGETKLGKDHPVIAIRLSNLAELMVQTNRSSEAEQLYRRALAIDERKLGREHPDVARDLNNLAALLYCGNRLEEVEPLCHAAFKILAKHKFRTGHEHPQFAQTRANFAGVLLQLGRHNGQIVEVMKEIEEDAKDEVDFGR